MFRAENFSHDTIAKALADLARFAEQRGFTFSKFESLGDEIVMLAATRWEHNANIALIQRQIPRDPIFCQLTNVDLQLTSEPREPVPGLIVVPERWLPGQSRGPMRPNCSSRSSRRATAAKTTKASAGGTHSRAHRSTFSSILVRAYASRRSS